MERIRLGRGKRRDGSVEKEKEENSVGKEKSLTPSLLLIFIFMNRFCFFFFLGVYILPL